MEIIVISLAAFLTATLTFFPGFGLGTILIPVFAILFPIEIAIALTGVVLFSNIMFKIVLVGRNADKEDSSKRNPLQCLASQFLQGVKNSG